jgi:hypothetical protein
MFNPDSIFVTIQAMGDIQGDIQNEKACKIILQAFKIFYNFLAVWTGLESHLRSAALPKHDKNV